jgi:hypothetical protein
VASLTLAGQVVAGARSASAAETCSEQPAPVVVCVPDPTLTGTLEVTATVSTGGPVDWVRFAFNGKYLLTDHDTDQTGRYTMSLDSRRLANGSGTLTATVMPTGGTATGATLGGLTVTNVEPVPAAAPFSPRLGNPAAGERFRLAAVGDGVDGSPESEAVAAHVAAWDPDAFAYLGDVYDRGSAFEFDTWYTDPQGFGQLRDITNPAVGNHEYTLDGIAAAYFAYWGDVPHYYSYDVGGWHVVVLDSTTDYNQVVPGTPQYSWLDADLAAHQGSCALAYLHHPRYTSVDGVSSPRLKDIWSLLVARNVTMALAGHAHTYERWTPMDGNGAPTAGGLTQFVVGTGGREILNPKLDEPRVVGDITTPGFLQLGLGAQDATFSFVDSQGVTRDSGTVPCRKPPDITGPTTPTASARATAPTAAAVSWSPSSDDTGVAGYTVRRAGAVVATVSGGVTSYADTGLRSGTAFAWTVEAFDAAGNRSAASAPATATTPFPTVSSRTLLRQLRRAPEHRAGFTATRFPGWTDADGDRCTTAAEVLLSEAVRAPTIGARCALTGGRWLSPYDGKSRTASSRMVVDHLVPLAEAWQSGAHGWRRVARRQLANDLGYPSTLVAVTRASAADKAAREPQDWLPRRAYRCAYTAQWVAVKWRWRLAVDPAERRFLVRRLTACDWPSVRQPGRAR